ncbi:hypothetical protein LX64_03409 [Chitinophaga skermanii]|uniref:Uncharacterized protein n=1 Tax=Chitinophaga skermanii TaxID=331697 RepID=A0A327QCL9_9BACT|nr:hypothetical protein LX64_03409 [Chitinophaga skermanii]
MTIISPFLTLRHSPGFCRAVILCHQTQHKQAFYHTHNKLKGNLLGGCLFHEFGFNIYTYTYQASQTPNVARIYTVDTGFLHGTT